MKDTGEEVRAGVHVTLAGVLVNAGLIAFKLAGGVLGQSQALVADAVHSVSDFFSDLVVLFGLRAGRQAPDAEHPFGHGRIETLASTAVGISLVVVAVYLGLDAIGALHTHTERSPNWIALVAAGGSIVSKELLFRVTRRVARRIGSTALLANAWHHRSDALSSVAVLAGVTGTLIRPEWHSLDAYAALLVSVLVVKVGLSILWENLRELTDTAPPAQEVDRMRACARSVDGVRDEHDLRVRTSGGTYQIEIHVVVDPQITVRAGHAIAKEVEECLLEAFGASSRVIVHVDPDMQAAAPPAGDAPGPQVDPEQDARRPP